MSDQAAQVLRQVQRYPGHNGRLACAYGAHDFRCDDPADFYQTCIRCGATYATGTWPPSPAVTP